MKKINGLALFILSVLLLIGCQQNDQASTNETNNATKENNEQVEEKPNPNEGKPTKSVDEIEEAALYGWQLDGFKIVLTSEDREIDTHEVTSAHGEEGEEFFIGDAGLYLIYEDDDVGYLQEEVDIEMLNLHERGFLKTFQLDEAAFVGWTNPIATNIHELSLFTVKEEELYAVTFDDKQEMSVSTTTFKTMDDKQIQFYRYLNQDPVGYHFYTYDWDEENNNFTEAAHSHLSMDDEEYTNLVVEAWQTDDDFFIQEEVEVKSAKPYTFTEKDISLFKEGKLIDESIQLGDNLGKVMQLKGLPAGVSYYSMEPGIYYDKDPFMYAKNSDENKQDITVIVYGGKYVENSLAELRDLFGEPVSDDYSLLDEAGILEYTFGSNSLLIVYDDTSEDIMEMVLIGLY